LSKRSATRVDEPAANADTIRHVHVDEVKARHLTEGQSDRSEVSAGNGEDVIRHAELSSSLAVRIDTFAGGQLGRATIGARRRLENWREFKRKRNHYGCEYPCLHSQVASLNRAMPPRLPRVTGNSFPAFTEVMRKGGARLRGKLASEVLFCSLPLRFHVLLPYRRQ
jgi:hypothetical protein